MKILIVGGYGTFGGRLADLLLDEPRVALLIAGRDVAKAEAFCLARRANAKAGLRPLYFDRCRPGEILAAEKPDLVVDASGPFQSYGADAYLLARAAIAAGCHYADLADGAAFVAAISVFDEAARQAGVSVLSGMSSFPVLTVAVSRVLGRELDQVDGIEAGIAPSPFAGVGLNVIRAIASYAGQPVDVKIDGRWQQRAGFFDSRTMLVHVPGEVPLPLIRFALTEVPDLKILSAALPEAHTVWMGAGPTPAVLHRLLWLMAGLVKFGILPSLTPFANLMNRVINTVRWGEHRGGLVLSMKGQKQGRPATASWHLLAEGEGGPFIPSMAVAALVRRFLDGKPPSPGARPGHVDLTLEDYAPWFKIYGIKTGVWPPAREPQTLYQKVLGPAFDRLDEQVRHFHLAKQSFRLAGKAKVTAGTSFLSAIVRRTFGFPEPSNEVDLKVEITVNPEHEIWTRNFGGRIFRSYQSLGKGVAEGLIVERFGPASVAIAVTENEGKLGLALRRWWIFGIPMPKALMPGGQFFEHGADGRFNFHVHMVLPLAGHIVTYQGWLSNKDLKG